MFAGRRGYRDGECGGRIDVVRDRDRHSRPWYCLKDGMEADRIYVSLDRRPRRTRMLGDVTARVPPTAEGARGP